MRLASALFALLFASNAYAGGVGLVAHGGVYQERLYYHVADARAPGGAVGPLEDSQMLPMGGVGLELLLGDRDDRIAGIARVYWQAEGPQSAPSGVPGVILATPRTNTRHVGAFSVGLQGGLVGNPDKGMLTILGLIGSGFLTADHTEFVFGEFGVGGTYRLNRTLQLHGNAMGHLRFRKWARGGATASAGIRVLFD